MPKFLANLPFADPRVRLAEGFASYVGVLGDPPGTRHLGIDYVLLTGRQAPRLDQWPLNSPVILGHEIKAQGFEVFSMHEGLGYQAVSDTWGTYVMVHWRASNSGPCCRTIYAHLNSVSRRIATVPEVTNGSGPFFGLPIKAGQYLGRAGTTGTTNGIIQLHIELHDLVEPAKMSQGWHKADPYGLEDIEQMIEADRSDGPGKTIPDYYPQPGSPLNKLPHHRWINDNPPLAISSRIR